MEIRRRVGLDGEPTAWFHGLNTCKSVWTCPVCAPRIAEARARELDEMVRTARAAGYRVVLVTLTFAHHAGQSLAEVLPRFRKALARAHGGRAWNEGAQRFNWLGYVRALEVTYGYNGWHPHAHELWVLPGGCDVEAFGEMYRAQWQRSLEYAGITGNEHAFRVDIADERIAAYVAKFGREPRWTPGRELARASSKRGRGSKHFSTWQLLELAWQGDEQARGLFLEYAAAFKGCRQLQWSPALRRNLALGEPMTDEEAAEGETVAYEVVARLDRVAWYRVYYNDAESDVLRVAARGTESDVLAYVAALPVPGLREAG